MKLSATLILVFVLNISSAISQNVKDNGLPSEISKNFKSEYLNISETEWEKEGDDYNVSFSSPEAKDINIKYDEQGHVLSKYMAVSDKEIPAKVLDYIKSNHSEQTIKKIWKDQLNTSTIFKVELQNEAEALGAITGTANGSATAISPDNATNSTRLDTSATAMSLTKASDILVLYLDNNGKPVTLDKVEKGAKKDVLNKGKANSQKTTKERVK